MFSSTGSEDAINWVQILLELVHQIDTELHVREIEKKGLIMMKEFPVADLDFHKNEIMEELKSIKRIDLEDTVARTE